MKHLLILVWMLALCHCATFGPKDDKVERELVVEKYILLVNSKQFDRLSGLVTKEFKIVHIDASKTKTVLEKSANLANYYKKNIQNIKLSGVMAMRPWYVTRVTFSSSNIPFERNCVFKIMETKISELACYIGNKEYNATHGTNLKIDSKNFLTKQALENGKLYNEHNAEASMANISRNFKLIKNYPDHVDVLSDSGADSVRQIKEYMSEANPRVINRQIFSNSPWVLEEIDLISRGRIFRRIVVNKRGEGQSLESIIYIGLKEHVDKKTRFKISFDDEWGILNPYNAKNKTTEVILRHQFETLVYKNKSIIIPNLATKWHWNKDKTKLTLTIDTRRRFTDGVEVSAAIVKKSWERGLIKKNFSKSKEVLAFLKNIAGYNQLKQSKELSGLKVINDETLEVHFTKTFEQALNILSKLELSVIRQWRNMLIGTGPYQLRQFKNLSNNGNIYFYMNSHFPNHSTFWDFIALSRDKSNKTDQPGALTVRIKNPGNCKEKSCTDVGNFNVMLHNKSLSPNMSLINERPGTLLFLAPKNYDPKFFE